MLADAIRGKKIDESMVHLIENDVSDNPVNPSNAYSNLATAFAYAKDFVKAQYYVEKMTNPPFTHYFNMKDKARALLRIAEITHQEAVEKLPRPALAQADTPNVDLPVAVDSPQDNIPVSEYTFNSQELAAAHQELEESLAQEDPAALNNPPLHQETDTSDEFNEWLKDHNTNRRTEGDQNQEIIFPD